MADIKYIYLKHFGLLHLNVTKCKFRFRKVCLKEL